MTKVHHEMRFDPLPDPSAKSASDAATFFRAVTRALSTFDLKGWERLELQTLMGKKYASERLLASNRRLRMKSTEILLEEFGKRRRKWEGVPDRRYWHVSFLGPLVNEYRPELDVDAYRQAVYRLLRSQHLNAIYAIELQALTNYPQKGQGRSFLMNAHALAWTDDVEFDAAGAQEAMRKSEALWSEFGADTVRFSPRNASDGQLEYLAYYLTKVPAKAKRRGKDPDHPGRWIMLPVAKVRADLQLRLLEILSRLEVTDLVWGVGDGKAIRRAWKSKLVAWNKLMCARWKEPLEKDFDVAELWERIRARPENGSRLYRRIKLFGPRPRPTKFGAEPCSRGKRLWPKRPEPPRVERKKLDFEQLRKKLKRERHVFADL